MDKNNKTSALQGTVAHKSEGPSNKKDKKRILEMLKGVESKMNKADDATVKLALEQLIETLNELLINDIKNYRQEYDKTINILGEFNDSLKCKQ